MHLGKEETGRLGYRLFEDMDAILIGGSEDVSCGDAGRLAVGKTLWSDDPIELEEGKLVI